MILTFDETGAILDELADSLPPDFYRELNGGVSLLPEELPDPAFPGEALYILGEYCHDQMGRYINLYYGSFAALARAEGWTQEDWEEELYTTLLHEFTHHLEGLAGENGLDRKDAALLEELCAQLS